MLDPAHHQRIIKDLDHICHTAGIPKLMMYKSATDFCDGEDLSWLRKFPVHQRELRGLIMTGKHNPPPDTKMVAMAAALLRNFIDARVKTVQDIWHTYETDKGGDMTPSPTVLLVPNLFSRTGKGAPDWKMQILYDLLLKRRAEGKLSVVYVEDLDKFEHAYGYLFRQHLEANYMMSSR